MRARYTTIEHLLFWWENVRVSIFPVNLIMFENKMILSIVACNNFHLCVDIANASKAFSSRFSYSFRSDRFIFFCAIVFSTQHSIDT